MDELKQYFKELFDEFRNRSTIFRSGIAEMFLFKQSPIPNPKPEFNRYEKGNGWQASSRRYFDTDYFRDWIIPEVKKLNRFKDIFKYVVDNNLSPYPVVSFEADVQMSPSITSNIISGFITRVYDLKLNEFIDLDPAFDQTFTELHQFFTNDNVEILTLTNLYGPNGSIDEITISENIKVKKADGNISTLFGLIYNDIKSHWIEMYINDYYVEIKQSVPKKEYFNAMTSENTLIDSVFKAIVLSSNGNIEIGKRIRLSSAWPLAISKRQSQPITFIDKYDYRNKFIYSFDEDSETNLTNSFKALQAIDFDALHLNIQASFKRFIKAKSQINIEDRIIELVIALEYLINTDPYEVSLQLSLKVIKAFENIPDKQLLFSDMKKFLKLRGDILHGNKAIKDSDENIALINKMECLIGELIIKFIKLSTKYSYKEINETLKKSLYHQESFEQLFGHNTQTNESTD